MPVELMSKGRNKWENRSYQKSENHNSLGWALDGLRLGKRR